jgi:hypothetical protein
MIMVKSESGQIRYPGRFYTHSAPHGSYIYFRDRSKREERVGYSWVCNRLEFRQRLSRFYGESFRLSRLISVRTDGVHSANLYSKKKRPI